MAGRNRTCSAPECDRPVKGRGLCVRHYQLARKDGTAAQHPLRVPLRDRLYDAIDRSGGPDSCWIWTRGKSSGYGVVGTENSPKGSTLVHRLIAAEVYGPLSEDDVVMHSCDNPPCCNPKHLIVATQAANIEDCERKGRGNHPRGSSVLTSKLTEEEVTRMRVMRQGGLSIRDLSDLFRVGTTAVAYALTGKTWKHVV